MTEIHEARNNCTLKTAPSLCAKSEYSSINKTDTGKQLLLKEFKVLLNLDLYLEFQHVFLNNHQWKSELQDFISPSVKHSNYRLTKIFKYNSACIHIAQIFLFIPEELLLQ